MIETNSPGIVDIEDIPRETIQPSFLKPWVEQLRFDIIRPNGCEIQGISLEDLLDGGWRLVAGNITPPKI